MPKHRSETTADDNYACSDGLRWDARGQPVNWIDIENALVYRRVPET